jgi:putative hemolysin
MAVMPLAATGDGWVWDVLGLLSVPLLVALNGFFVAAEFALVAVRKTRVEELTRQGVRRAGAVREAITHLDRSIAATQLGITLASLALGWIGEPALAVLVEPAVEAIVPAEWVGTATHSVAFAIAFTLITFMHVVFGELIPKTMALQTPDRTSLWVAAPLLVFIRLTRPIILAMNGTGNVILRWAGYRTGETEALVHSVDELGLLIDDTQEAGILTAGQADVVRKVFRLSAKKVGECLVSRDRVSALELRTPPAQVLDAVRRGAHTRMPVYDGDPDNVVGIVNTKDLIYLFSLKGVVILEDALYPPLFLAPEDTVEAALELFKKERRHLAVIRDGGGKVQGVITLEDVLEEIVGEIEDEHDRAVPRLRLRPFPQAGPRP